MSKNLEIAQGVYYPNNKPTPEEIGALPTTGGVLTGPLVTDSKVSISGADIAGVEFEALAGDARVVMRHSSGGAFLGHASSATNWTGYLRVGGGKFEYYNGSITYDVYHTGRKPTWADVGGNSYFTLGSDGYIRTVDNRWNMCGGAGVGWMPSASGTGGSSKSYLGNSSWWFKEAWANSYRGGSINITGGLSTNNQGSSWISQKDASNVPVQMTISDSSYGAAIRWRSSSRTTTVGSLGNSQWGFFGYNNSQTTNATNWSCYMDYAGNWFASGNITAYSDARVKTDVRVIDNALHKVQQIRGVTYKRTDIDDGIEHCGVIAQEIEKVLPQVISETKNGDIDDFKTVAYGNISALLIEAIKELKAEVDHLREELEKCQMI